MLTADVEVDPLNVKGPLDCITEFEHSAEEEDLSKWAVLYEHEIVREVISDRLISDVEVRPCRNLRIRKPKVMSEADDCNGDDDDLSDFKSEGIKKRGRRKKRRNKVSSVKKGGRKKYVCNSCNKRFDTASQKEDHLLNHHQHFPCEECGKIFSRLESLQKHLIYGHTGEVEDEDDEVETVKQSNGKKYYDQLKTKRKHQCLVCSKTFITVSHLNAHMSCHSGKKWKCDGCGRNFSCERSLTRHRDTFPGEHWFPCQYCDMNFFRVENILKHLDIKHPEASLKAREAGELVVTFNGKENVGTPSGSQIFICTKCTMVFHDVEGSRTHRETVHSCASGIVTESETDVSIGLNGENIPLFKCEICSKGFVSLEGFEYHRNNQHVEKGGKKPKKGKDRSDDHSDESDNSLEKVEEKRKVQNFDCDVCAESLPTKSSLEVHMKSHICSKVQEVKAGIHQCCICPRTFASSDGLKYHLATHTGERRYSCSHCGKKFIKKTHLYEHVATHSQVKCFKCPRCPRTFSTHSAYRKHIKHFPGPHSFPCAKCGKLFTKESMLEKHMCVDLVNVTMAPEVKALLVEENGESQSLADGVSCTPATAVAREPPVENREHEPSDESHSCYKCFKVFPSLDQLQTHQYEHIGKQQYKCRFCPENFKRADDFSAHIRSHLGSAPYMCLKCNRKFISPLTLSMHAKKYPGDHSFTCPKCQRWFPSEKKLDKHECILQSAESFACACGSKFKSWNEFQQHAGSKPYKCCSCDLKYLTLIALVRHIKRHTGVKPFSCETCGKAFRAKSNYLHHLEIHKSAKEIQCEHCEFKSKSKKRMDFHLFRKHDIGSNTSSTLCPVCGIMFPYMTHVKKHMETEHGNEIVLEESKGEKKALPVLCTLCGKLLSNKYMLANHMRKVHDPDAQKSIQEYKCEVCEEKFRSKKRLSRHLEVHEAPGLRVCEICSLEFYYAKDLRKHMKRHDTNKPFSCPICGKTFKVSVSLKYHSSICGTGNGIVGGAEKAPEENDLSSGHVYYGHIDPVNVKNVMYQVVSAYRKWT